MIIQILKLYSENIDFIDDVRKHADDNRDSLGFLPADVYEEQARKKRLYVAIDSEMKKYLGHILYGGRFPNIKIFQLLVVNKARRLNVGTQLLNSLIRHGEKIIS